MRIRYTLRARGDLEAIFNYLQRHSPAAAKSVKGAIRRRIQQLSDFPFVAPPSQEPGVYELTAIRYPYKVYYRVEENEIRIVHIRHSARRPFGPSDQ